ncbi:MAG: hypothetical protein JXR95_02055 [Deltaproteobacteria bacterium]|nr:hypothetical protein [Deltaproteobacteria bacterium]
MNYMMKGDKRNSEFLNTYLPMVYERRHESGIDQLVNGIKGIVMSVCRGDALPYISRLYLMTPYRFVSSYLNSTHRIYILEYKKNLPLYIILEPLSDNFVDELTEMNMLYPLSRKKPNARYVGEIFQCQDKNETVKILQSQDIIFHKERDTPNQFYSNNNFIFSKTSTFTRNRIGYTSASFDDPDSLGFGEKIIPSEYFMNVLQKMDEIHQSADLDKYIGGIDHIATRLLYGDREEAILEFLTMTNYYYWGAYNIEDQNSSTNVTRHPGALPDASMELNSPAKVFTANNTPAFLNSFLKLPMPTETFVLRYGRRLHHLAFEIKDIRYSESLQAIDYVVSRLKDNSIEFLARVFGGCEDGPDLRQIFSRTCGFDNVITEYVQRCKNFQGFFTKENVGDLTAAAGLEVAQREGVYD